MAPFTPFFSEHMHLSLRSESDPESVHLCDWPESRKPDEDILKSMEETRRVVSLALEKRMAAGIKVRQPLSKLKIKGLKDGKMEKPEEGYIDLIKDEVNVKEVVFERSESGSGAKVELDTEITAELKKEGNVRELVRAIQELRKNKNLVPADTVELLIETDEAGKQLVIAAADEIKKPTNVSEIRFEPNRGSELEIGDLKFKISLS
jgi:isoleucyl-tRNA synthetase